MRFDSGFTTVEMVVVLTVATLLLAIAGPPLTRIHKQTRLRQAVDTMAASHSFARATAIQTGSIAELHIDPNADQHWVQVDTGATGVPTTVGGIVRFKRVDLSSDRTLLCFDPRGMPTTSGACESPDATMVFQLVDLRDTLRITGLGRVVR